jgi:hypothetical protein
MAVTHPDQLLFKWNIFQQQLQFDFVVVVAGREPTQFQRHGISLNDQMWADSVTADQHRDNQRL